jgi:hypothetical protein
VKALKSMKSPYTFASLVAGAAMFAGLPAFAQDTPDTMPAPATAAAPETPATPAPAASKMTAMQQKDVDAHIKKLHDQLKITPAQEGDWQKVAQVMEDNAASMSSLMQDRDSHTTMTAIDDLKSYQAITAAHADGLKNLVNSFEQLYDEMSPDQQKNADMVFARHIEKKSKK